MNFAFFDNYKIFMNMNFFDSINHQNSILSGDGNRFPGPPVLPPSNKNNGSGCLSFLLILFFSILVVVSFGQTSFQASNICEGLTTKSPLPMSYSGPKDRLIPDPCNAKDSYGSQLALVYAPDPGYVEQQRQIKVITESIWDSRTCQMTSREVSRDTIIVHEEVIPSQSPKNVGGYWTVRMELMVKPPDSRPVGAMVSKLPSSNLEGYWVVHMGSADTKEEIQKYLKPFKAEYPEFCRAYVYWLPFGIEYQYEYR